MSGRPRVDGSSAPSLLDDAEAEAARNGTAAVSDLVAKEARVINHAAHCGRPLFSWVIRGVFDEFTPGPLFRQIYAPRNFGAQIEAGVALWMPHNNDPDGDAGFTAGQGIEISIDGTAFLTRTDFDTVAETTYPEDVRRMTLLSNKGYINGVVEFNVDTKTDNRPQVRAGSIWQGPLDTATAAAASNVGIADLHQKGEIVGTRSSSQEHVASLLTTFNNAWLNMRPQIGWSAANPGANPIEFTTSGQNFRYIFSQAYGTSGTSFSASGPAITLPLMYSAAGRRNQIRVYVFVYAAMSGATNTGTIGVANRASNATMASSASALTNGSTISGTTFAWYPTLASFDPATAPYFNGYAGSVPDRVALCAKSSGATDHVRVGAFTMLVLHSVL